MTSHMLTKKSDLAILGGTPVRSTLLAYGRQSITNEDVLAVTKVLESDWLTTGPTISEFEKEFAKTVGVREAVAVSSGTAALHATMNALGIREGDEIIVPTMTFVSTANAVVFQQGTPVFVDSDPATLLIDPDRIADAITDRTKAIIAVDYAGQPADYTAIYTIAHSRGIPVVADACHALGGHVVREYGGKDVHMSVGSLADLNCFSFHPVKPLVTGEGGMVTTNDETYANIMRKFRNHFLSSDHRERHEKGSWEYEMTDLGYNYRLTDIQCALGLSQLKGIRDRTKRRQEIAHIYNDAFTKCDFLKPLYVKSDIFHAYHLYVVLLNLENLTTKRAEVFQALRAEGIGINVHYKPVHLHEFYRKTFGTGTGLCSVAESAYERILSLPVFSGMNDHDVHDVIKAVTKVCSYYSVS
jgi:perosamine synthetase